MKIWYFHCQYKANGLGINETSSNILNFRHVSKVAAHFQKKNKMFVYSFKYPNKESGNFFKKQGCTAIFRTLPNIYDGSFLRKYKRPKALSYVCYGSKYIPEVVQDSKINLKWMNSKMLEKTTFLQCGPFTGYTYVDISQDIRSSSSYLYYYIVVLKNLAKLTGMHLQQSLFSTCNLQLHWKRNAGISSFLWVLRKFLGTLLLWKTSCELVLKGEFWGKWQTYVFIIIKRYREVDSSFKKETLQGKVYIWEPLIESWRLT